MCGQRFNSQLFSVIQFFISYEDIFVMSSVFLLAGFDTEANLIVEKMVCDLV